MKVTNETNRLYETSSILFFQNGIGNDFENNDFYTLFNSIELELP